MITFHKMKLVLCWAALTVNLAQVSEITRIEQFNLPEDTTARMVASELLVQGNTLITTSELLKHMPEVYVASGKRSFQVQPDLFMT